MLTTRTKIALAAAVQRPVTAIMRLSGRGPQIQATRSGLRWNLDLDEGIDFSIWLLGAFERATVAAYSRFVRPGMTVLDIGANIGAHTLPLARLVGDAGRVIAVEPTQWANRRLRANLMLNPELERRVLVRQVMLVGSEQEPLPDSIYASWPLHGTDVHPKLRAQAKSTEGAQAITLDALLEREGIERVDFVKLDVDGHECAVLRGGLASFKRHRPVMIMELSPYGFAEAGGSLEELLSLLSECGYRLRELGSDRALPMDAAALQSMIPDGGGINVVVGS